MCEAVGDILIGLQVAREISMELRNLQASYTHNLESWLSCYQDWNLWPKVCVSEQTVLLGFVWYIIGGQINLDKLVKKVK